MKNWLNRFIDATARRPGGRIGKSLYRESNSHRPGFELIKKSLKVTPLEDILEVGCGGGVLLNELLSVANSGAAIDHSEDMISLAKERNAEAIEAQKLDLRLGSVYELPWENQRFDAVISSHMFFFIEKPETMLSETFRTLKPGGRIIILTSAKSFWGKILLMPYYKAMFFYTDQQLHKLLETAGFTNIHIRTENPLQQVAIAYKANGSDT